MILDGFISRARANLARRKRYNQLINEINGLSERDLADMRGNRDDMLHHVRREFYG